MSEPTIATAETDPPRETEQARRDALAALGLLTAGVVHEINSPLGFVHSNLEVLSKYTGRMVEMLKAYSALERAVEQQGLFPEERESLAACRRRNKIDVVVSDQPALVEQCLDGTGLVRQLVDALKGVSPASATSEAEVEDCIDRALLVARHYWKGRAEIVRESADTPTARCSASELGQLVINLLVNAAQSIATQGTITVRSRAERDRAIIEIEDDGCGIPAENLERICDPFFTTRQDRGGTGLGLMLVSDLIKKNDGTIDFDSAPGRGTRVRVSLPLVAG